LSRAGPQRSPSGTVIFNCFRRAWELWACCEGVV
jgi:hypothetical protein